MTFPLVQFSGADLRFVTSLDAFGGNSGSGVFNANTFEMMGILVSGAKDYEP